MTIKTTNASTESTTLAQAIADSRSAHCASIMSVVTTLKGVVRLAPGEKRGGLKVRMGDDTVRDTFVAGRSYRALKQRDSVILDGLTGADLDTFVAEGHMAWSGRDA